MKRMISLCCAGLMAFSLAACGSQNAASSSTSTPQVTSAVVGKITALDGTTVTLQLGELTENQPSAPPDQDDAQPNGDSSASGQTPPEKPEGQDDSNQTAKDNGTAATLTIKKRPRPMAKALPRTAPSLPGKKRPQ